MSPIWFGLKFSVDSFMYKTLFVRHSKTLGEKKGEEGNNNLICFGFKTLLKLEINTQHNKTLIAGVEKNSSGVESK